MKLVIFSILIAFCLITAECRSSSFPTEDEHSTNKRFLGSIGSWINNNIINPIGSGINTVIDVVGGGINTVIDAVGGGINNVINTISDPLAQFGNMLQGVLNSVDDFFSNTLTNAVNDAINTIRDETINIVNMVSNVIFPSGGNQPPAQDACQTTCFQRVNYNGQLTDYYFDRPNGCISKGIIDPHVSVFNSCCDKHNQCLNSKCCTTDCQNLKNQCDTEYDTCIKSSCVQYISDNTQFYTCLARGAYVASLAVNRTCSATITANRKICYC